MGAPDRIRMAFAAEAMREEQSSKSVLRQMVAGIACPHLVVSPVRLVRRPHIRHSLSAILRCVGIVVVVVGSAMCETRAQGREPPELSLPRVVVVGLDTLRLGGVKASLRPPQAMPLQPLVPRRRLAPPATGTTNELGRAQPHAELSLACGPQRTVRWRLGADAQMGNARWAGLIGRASSRDNGWGLGAWWREEFMGSGGGALRSVVRWERTGLRASNGQRVVMTARPRIEWRGEGSVRAGWVGAGERDGDWKSIWYVEGEVPLGRILRLRGSGHGRTGATIGVLGHIHGDTWGLSAGPGIFAPEGRAVDWLGEARAWMKVQGEALLTVAGRRRAVAHDPASLLQLCPYTEEAPNEWAWGELRNEAEMGLVARAGPVHVELGGGTWRSRDHPQWESPDTCTAVNGEGSWLAGAATWHSGVLDVQATARRNFSAIDTQEEGLHYLPAHDWSVRVAVRVFGVELATAANAVGSRRAIGHLDPYVVLGAEARASVTRHLDLIFRGANLLEEEYKVWEGYPAPGATMAVGVDLTL